VGNILFDRLTGRYFIWSRSSTWFWPLLRFANLWALWKCVDWRISLLVFASQTVFLSKQELMLEQKEMLAPKQIKDFFML